MSGYVIVICIMLIMFVSLIILLIHDDDLEGELIENATSTVALSEDDTVDSETSTCEIDASFDQPEWPAPIEPATSADIQASPDDARENREPVNKLYKTNEVGQVTASLSDPLGESLERRDQSDDF